MVETEMIDMGEKGAYTWCFTLTTRMIVDRDRQCLNHFSISYKEGCVQSSKLAAVWHCVDWWNACMTVLVKGEPYFCEQI